MDLNDLKRGEKSLDDIVAMTLKEMHRHRDMGKSEADFVMALWGQFIRLIGEYPAEAGALHMSLSCYKLAKMIEVVQELQEKVDFQKDAIDFLIQLGDEPGA